MTGTAWATLPTSSSFCIIFLILAGGNLALKRFFLEGIFSFLESTKQKQTIFESKKILQMTCSSYVFIFTEKYFFSFLIERK